VLDPEGHEVQSFEPEAVRRVISPATARTLTELLTRVVREGTGKQAAVAGYEVAGKTGTAQKLDPLTRRYSSASSVLSFVGFAPARDPRFVMLVLLDEPRTARWGSEAAAPVFAAVGSRLLPYFHVAPQETPPLQIVRGLSHGWVIPVSTAGSGLPFDGALERARMPSLVGQPLRPALATLSAYPVEVELHGQGMVVAQQPDPGAELEPGTICRLELAPPPARSSLRDSFP